MKFEKTIRSVLHYPIPISVLLEHFFCCLGSEVGRGDGNM